jgi:hypothetical protein
MRDDNQEKKDAEQAASKTFPLPVVYIDRTEEEGADWRDLRGRSVIVVGRRRGCRRRSRTKGG